MKHKTKGYDKSKEFNRNKEYIYVLSTNLIDAFLVVRTDRRKPKPIGKDRKRPKPLRIKKKGDKH